jgi:hypothetical protein
VGVSQPGGACPWFEFTESIRIEAPPAAVGEHIADVERWWLASNPEHIRIDVRGAGESA